MAKAYGLLFGLLALTACDEDGIVNTDNCAGGMCECPADGNCTFMCADSPCQTTCDSISNCDGTCGDDCDVTCDSSSNCDLSCGDNCQMDCDSVSNCEVECGSNCDVECVSLSNCRVTMVSGVARCESVSDCAIRCAMDDGTSVEAEDCGEERWACGGCP